MINQNFNKYAEGLSKIDEGYRAGALYRKDFSQGTITNKSLGGLLWSVAQHAYYVVTHQNEKIKSIEKEQLISLFRQNISYLDSNKSSKDLSTAKNLTSKDLVRLNMISKAFKEKFPPIKKLIEENTGKLITFELKKPLGKELLFSDKDFEALPIYSKLKPANLKQFLGQLNNESESYYGKCLALSSQINSHLLFLSLNGQLEFTNVNGLTAVNDMASSIYLSLQPLHDKFKSNFGTVPIVDGQLRPSLKQLKGAFELSIKEIVPHLPDKLTPEGQVLLARMTQYIMCGDQINSIAYPENEFCFTTQEFSTIEDKLELPKQFHNPFEWHIKASENLENNLKDLESVQNEINTLQKKLNEVRQELNTQGSILLSVEELDERDFNLKVREIDLVNHRKELMIQRRKLIDTRKELFQSQFHSYIEQFLKDIQRLNLVKFKDNAYHTGSNEKDIEMLFAKLRDDFFEQVDDVEKQAKWIEFNKNLAETASIPNDLTFEKFEQILVKNSDRSPEKARIINSIKLHASFTPEQLAKLLKSKEPNQHEEYIKILEAQLRSRFLQVMLLLNQSTLGVDPTLFGKNIETHPQFKLGAVNYPVPLTFLPLKFGGNTYFDLDSNSHRSILEVSYSLSEEQANSLGVDTRLESNPMTIPMLHLNRKLEISNFIDQGEQAPLSLTNYSNICFRVQSLPLLDHFAETFIPQESA
jgi:hypothetical protein